ncbi:MAG: hypothetical protein K1X56_03985 [Flavobacteriales bacterium]|nr:hypothetical protein [Flavobacteriales bacterium]
MFSLKSRFFKVRDPKKFSYTPRYYNERKERLDDLVRSHSEKTGTDPEKVRREFNFRDNMNSRWQSKNHATRDARDRHVRLLVLIAGLVGVCLYAIKRLELWDSFF